MIIRKYSRTTEKSRSAATVEAAASSSSSSSVTVTPQTLDRDLWGNHDDGSSIDGPIHASGSVYAHKARDYDNAEEPLPPFEDEEGDEGGNLIAEETVKGKNIRATERIFLPYPTEKDEPQDLAPLIKKLAGESGSQGAEAAIPLAQMKQTLAALAPDIIRTGISHVYQLTNGSYCVGVLLASGDTNQGIVDLTLFTRQDVSGTEVKNTIASGAERPRIYTSALTVSTGNLNGWAESGSADKMASLEDRLSTLAARLTIMDTSLSNIGERQITDESNIQNHETRIATLEEEVRKLREFLETLL